MIQGSASALRIPGPSRADCPLLFAALALVGGILLGRYWWHGPLWWAAALAVFVVAAFFYACRRTWLSIPLALAAFLAAGALGLTAHEFLAAPPDITALDGSEVMLVAHVARESAVRALGGEEAQSVDLESEAIAPLPELARRPFQRGATPEDIALAEQHASAQPLRIGVRATLYDRDAQEEDEADSGDAGFALHYGERVRLAGKLRRPHNFGNPGAFDYKGYLADRGISALIAVRADHVERLPGFAGSRPGAWRNRIRNSLLARIRELWPKRDAALLSAMLVSERSQVTREARLDFQRSGTYHLLVVAGLHLGLLAGFCYWLLRRLRANDLMASMATIAFACGYAWLADDGVPVWRATLMLALYLAARLLYRPHAALNAIGGAALVLLALDPGALFSPSFQLSFTAVLAIVAIAAPLLERISEPYVAGLRQLDSAGYDVRLDPRIAQFRLDLRMIAGRLEPFFGRWAARLLVVRTSWLLLRAFELIVLSLVMQLALALPTAWYFHRATTFSVVANLFAVPLAGVLLPAALVSLAGSYISPGIAHIAAGIASAALHAISRTSFVFGHLPEMRLATPGVPVVAVCLAAFPLAAIVVRRNRWLAAVAMALFAFTATLPIIAPPPLQRRTNMLEVTAIDVGQGDALLVISPDGRTLLVDAGGQLGPTHSDFDYGEDVVAPYLWSRGITRLDAVALTHAHQDHLGGMNAVLGNFRPRELWLGVAPDTAAMRGLLAQARMQSVAVRQFASGDAFAFGGAQMRVLAPPRDYAAGARAANNDSMVLKLAFGGTSALLAGDIEKKIEHDLAGSPAVAQPGMYADLLPLLKPATNNADIRADLLKVAHHGSATSTTPEFLAAVHPRVAVISDGLGNNFGHPRLEVLTRLEQAQVATYRTDTSGAVSFFLDGKDIEVCARRICNSPPSNGIAAQEFKSSTTKDTKYAQR